MGGLLALVVFAQAPGRGLAQDVATGEAEVTPAAVQAPATGSEPGRYRGAPLEWQPHWQRFDLGHYVLTATSVGIVVSKFLVGPIGNKRRGGVLVDDDVRDALRIGNLSGRRFARDASDVLLETLESYNFFDALVVAGWYRESPEVAKQVALISLETLAVTAAVQAVLNVSISRERPFGPSCGVSTPEDTRDCDSQDRFFSFFSGHTSQAFASAALICTHHMHLPLYGGGTGDTAVCVGGFVASSAVGVLRIMGDQHYVTDVVAGAGVGTLVGFGLPWLLHYRDGPPTPLLGSLSLQLVPTPNGAVLVGSF